MCIFFKVMATLEYCRQNTIEPKAKKTTAFTGCLGAEATDFFYVKKMKSCKTAPFTDSQLRTKRSYDEVFGDGKKAVGLWVSEGAPSGFHERTLYKLPSFLKPKTLQALNSESLVCRYITFPTACHSNLCVLMYF